MDTDTARLVLKLQEQIDSLWRYLGHDERAKELRERARDIEGKVAGYRKELQDVIRHQHEESSKYFNTVMAVGYAGYFAGWTLTKENLDHWHSSFVGLMGLISLATFIIWELLMMQFRMQNLTDLNNFFRDMISVDDFEPLRQRQMQKDVERIAFWQPVWRIVFVVSALTAATGAADLMLQLYRNL